MDATAYTLQMRRFAEALKPILNFFAREVLNDEDEMQYLLLCGSIIRDLEETEHRLIEVAAKKKYGEAEAAQALKDVDVDEAEQAEVGSLIPPEDVFVHEIPKAHKKAKTEGA